MKQKAMLVDFLLVRRYQFKPPVNKKDIGLSFMNVPPPSLDKIVWYVLHLEPFEAVNQSQAAKKKANSVFVSLVYHLVCCLPAKVAHPGPST
jgi:hypothetical protein